jgi:hypothetical protein
MSMSHAYGVPNDEESIATLHTALDLGINFWDTAVYGSGKNEELISKVLTTNRDKIFIATKFGFTQDSAGKFTFKKSGKVSPTVVHKTFIIQKNTVTSGTLLMISFRLFFFIYFHLMVLFDSCPNNRKIL